MSQTVARVRGRGGSYGQLFRAAPMERIALIRRGVPAAEAKVWLEMGPLGRSAALQALDLPVATFNRKVKAGGTLSQAESERVVGFARLVGQVEAMVEEAGEAQGFDAKAWLAGWLVTPVAALGGAVPLDLLGTMEGQALVSQVLAQMASGAYG